MNEERGKMTVSEAGRRGGKATSKKYGHEFYEEIGRKGGLRVKELIERGKKGGTAPSRGEGPAPAEEEHEGVAHKVKELLGIEK